MSDSEARRRSEARSSPADTSSAPVAALLPAADGGRPVLPVGVPNPGTG
ncbi:MAG TPA: hypothetical protein VMF86_05130 [Stellaceae bacterium]|nr:hypothetical protein [Stellaceae bacterium]